MMWPVVITAVLWWPRASGLALSAPIINTKTSGGAMTWPVAATALLGWPRGRSLTPLVLTVNAKPWGGPMMWPVTLWPFCGGHGDMVWFHPCPLLACGEPV